MQRRTTLLLFSAVMVMTANCFAGEYFGKMKTTYLRNTHWPHPFVEVDRAASRAPIAVMVHNGWRLQNLVAEHHYEPDTFVVNEAGQMHIRSVMTLSPQGRRTIYVQHGATPEETEARMESVRLVAQRYSLAGEPVEVYPTNVYAPGTPAEYIHAINERFGASTPDPRLPKSTNTGFSTSN